MTGKKIYLISIIISLLIILLAGAAWLILGSNPAMNSLFNKEPAQKKDYVLSESVVELPFPINDSRINEVYIAYGIYGNVTGLQNTPQGTEIIIDQIGLPKLIVNPNVTQFFYWDENNSKAVPTSQNNLKVGNYIRGFINYDLKLKTWSLKAVSIIVDSLPKEASASTKSS